MSSKLIGIDFGLAKIVYLYQIRQNYFNSLKLLDINKNELLKKLNEIAIENDVNAFVIGYPLNMNNKKNEMTELVDQFKADLIKMNFKVYLQDERLSSESAKKIIQQQSIKTGENKEKIDLIASTIILQSFLDKGAT